MILDSDDQDDKDKLKIGHLKIQNVYPSLKINELNKQTIKMDDIPETTK